MIRSAASKVRRLGRATRGRRAALSVLAAVLVAAMAVGAGPVAGPALGAAPTPTFVTKWGSQGSADGQFSLPAAVATDSAGDVYVADFFNNRVQKFSSDGTFITKWGSYGSGDGQFMYPRDVDTDLAGNVYVLDAQNNRIQKFSSDGTFITKWGSQGSGDGQFYGARGIATDSAGNVYVADWFNNRIQKFSSDGTFITKWGSQGSTDGRFNEPADVDVNEQGYVYVADSSNHRVQKFSDIVAPVVVKLVPAAGAKKVAHWANVEAAFSDQMEPATINKSTFRLYKKGSKKPMRGSVTLDSTGKTAVLNPYGMKPSRHLVRGATYKAVITTEVKDLAGNPMAAKKAWSFKIR